MELLDSKNVGRMYVWTSWQKGQSARNYLDSYKPGCAVAARRADLAKLRGFQLGERSSLR